MVLSATPDARLIDSDPRNRIAIIEVPDHLVAAVRTAGGQPPLRQPWGPKKAWKCTQAGAPMQRHGR